MEAVMFEERPSGWLLVTLNRPEIRNAVNYQVMDGLQQAVEIMKKNHHLKAMAITGAGTAFCSGGDLKEFHSLKTKDDAYKMLRKMGNVLQELAFLPVPVVAFLNGTAVGGGCEIASACDVRYAKKGINLGFIQGTLGISTGWGGASYLFEKTNYATAINWLTTAKRHTAAEGIEAGFVSGLLDEVSLESMEAVMSQYTALHRDVLTSYKTTLTEKWHQSGLKERVENEIGRCAELWEKDSHLEAVEAFFRSK